MLSLSHPIVQRRTPHSPSEFETSRLGIVKRIPKSAAVYPVSALTSSMLHRDACV